MARIIYSHTKSQDKKTQYKKCINCNNHLIDELDRSINSVMCQIKNYRHVLNHTSGKLVDVSVCVTPISWRCRRGLYNGEDKKMEGWEGKEQRSCNYIGSYNFRTQCCLVSLSFKIHHHNHA